MCVGVAVSRESFCVSKGLFKYDEKKVGIVMHFLSE